MRAFFVVVLIVISSSPVVAERRTAAAPRAEDYEVYLVTMGPGASLFTRFGHNAIRLVKHGRACGGHPTLCDVVYNWGTFDGAAPWLDMASKFFRRKLEYWLDRETWNRTVLTYQRRDRSIWLQKLDLPLSTVLALEARILENLASPQYEYDYFRDNCSTRVRDMLDGVLGGAFREQVGGAQTGTTLRSLMLDILAPAPATGILLDILLNERIDQPLTRWDELYLPREVRAAARAVRLRHPDGSVRPLVSLEATVYERKAAFPAQSHPWGVWLFCALLLLPAARALFSRQHATRHAGWAVFAWGLVVGVVGCLLTFTTTRPHPDAAANANLLFFTPLHLSLVVPGWRLRKGTLGRVGVQLVRWFLVGALCVTLVRLGWLAAGWAGQLNLRFGLFALVGGALVLAAARRGTWRCAIDRVPETAALDTEP